MTQVARATALLLGLSCACSKSAVSPPTLDASANPQASVSATVAATSSTGVAKRPSAQSSKGALSKKQAPPKSLSAVPEPAAAKIAGGDLKAEEPEANPYSESVMLKLTVTPQVKALVMWGGKQMAKLGPGSMDTEIVRPRGSGPVDLEIKAEGYMPLHTRLYSDRNDKVAARLYRPEEAPGLLGFKRSSSPTEKK